MFIFQSDGLPSPSLATRKAGNGYNGYRKTLKLTLKEKPVTSEQLMVTATVKRIHPYRSYQR